MSSKNIVQPDVFVVLNEHLDRIAGTRVIGAPDLVVEIASPSTVRHDLGEKLTAYARAGVPEYWRVVCIVLLGFSLGRRRFLPELCRIYL